MILLFLGPRAYLLSGVHTQSYVAHVMAFAARIGPYADFNPLSNSRVITGNIFLQVISFYILLIVNTYTLAITQDLL